MKIKTTFIVLFILNSAIASSQRSNLIFESTFESQSSISQWYERSIYNTWSAVISTDQVRAGKGSLRVDLIRGIDVLNGPRAELGMAPQKTNEFWYGFSNFFPTNYISDPATEIINQWQAQPDFNLGELWRSPPLDLEIKADRFKIAIRTSSAKVTTAQNTVTNYIDIGAVDHNIWNDWIFHVKWSYNSGTLQIWKNGVLVLERLNLPIGYNDATFPYFKAGIYKWEWSLPNTISISHERFYYIDEIRVGNQLATYNDVAPGDLPNATNSLPIVPASLKVKKNSDGSYLVTFTASKTVIQPSKFILYISYNNGNYSPITYDSLQSLIKGQVYTFTFKAQ